MEPREGRARSRKRKRSKIPRKSASDVVARHPGSELVLTRKDLSYLKPGQWLNDECVNYYIALLRDRHLEQCKKARTLPSVGFFNSYFYTKLTNVGLDARPRGYSYSNVRRWTKPAKLKKLGLDGRNSIFELDWVLFPVNIENQHWVCGGLNIKAQQFVYLDSLRRAKEARAFFAIMREYVKDEYADKVKKDTLDIETWTERDHEGRYGVQIGGTDCGVFTLYGLRALATGSEPRHEQKDMERLRKELIIAIKEGVVV